MKPATIAAVLFTLALGHLPSAVSAEESGLPNQSSGQEPEVPGNNSTTGAKPVPPDSKPAPKSPQEQQEDAQRKAEKLKKCAPGQDAKACREYNVKHRKH